MGNMTNNQMPQDYWVDQGISVTLSETVASTYSLPPVADQMNRIYWATRGGNWTIRTALVTNGEQQTLGAYQSQIVLMDSELNTIKTFGSFWDAQGMACDASNNLYVLDSDGRVFVYDSNQNLVTNFLTGCQNGRYIPIQKSSGSYSYWTSDSITNYSGYSSYMDGSSTTWNGNIASKISINTKSELFICDFGSALVKVFSTNGTLKRSWGGVGIGMTNFATAPWGVQVNPDQTVSVIDNTSTANGTWQNGANIIKNFDANGNYLGQSSLGRLGNGWSDGNNMPLAITPDGLRKSPLELGLNKNYTTTADGYYYQWIKQGCYLPNGDLIILRAIYNHNNISSSYSYLYSINYLFRNYYGKDLPLSNMPPPLPIVLGQSQRAGTTYLDIDYKLIAATNTPVKVGMLAFVNGQTNLDSVIIPKTFVNGTGANLGANISPNTTKRVTWDMGRDWSTNVGTVQIEILANDGRPLQPQMWTNNPSNLPSKLTGTVTDSWSMWLWLLSTQDTRVKLVNGTVQGNSGNYYGRTLYGITGTNQNTIGYTNQIYTNSDGSTWTNNYVPIYSTNYIYDSTTNGQQFLQDIVDSQVPLIR